ncbi:MAG: arginase [Bacteroidetes bacterium]|nr:MAG: arginase [Bacteroidota bacterium]MBL1145034.1 arginase [Bacteroidota bacterium]NOG57831.1 arginase [Bacteroidota bacterium]
MKTIQLLEQKSEIGAGTRGASLGIDALKVASLNQNNMFFLKYKTQKIAHQNHLLYEENRTPTAIRIEGIVKVYEATSEAVKEVFKNNKFPLVLSGDHASAGGTIAGVRAANPDKSLGVIWIDAHGDLHSPYTSPTGNIHGMPLATALGEDNLDFQIKEIKDEAKIGWDALKNCQGFSPKIKPEDLIFFGVRDTEEPEDKLIEKLNLKNYTVAETRALGIQQAVKDALKRLQHCDLIYISFDVDSMDCDLVSRGTGTPVPNGYTPEEAFQIIEEIIKSGKVACFEMVEVNPTLDNKINLMAETAFHILEKTVDAIEKYSK